MASAPAASGYEFSSDPARIDRDRVHGWLSDDAYWARGRTREVQDAAIDASRNFGIYDEDGVQVAYARVVTDGVLFAWLCDVYVAPSVRGRGLGSRLVAGIVAELDALGIRRTLLATADAQEVYRPWGFDELSGDLAWMARIASTPQG